MISAARDFNASTSLTPPPYVPMSPRRATAYDEGLESCLRVVRSQAGSSPEKQIKVLANQARELATFVKVGGISKVDAVDGLAGAAEEAGIDTDVTQAIMFEAFASDAKPNTSGSMGSLKLSTPQPTSGWRNSTISASDLRAKTFDPVRYVVPDLIPEGVTVFAGKPKIGKSWFLFDVCVGTATDRFVLGSLKPPVGDVLYLALEDSQRRLQTRLKKILPQGEWPLRLTLATEWRRADANGIEDLGEWCDSVPNPLLIVIDTLETFRPAAKPASSAYTTDYLALSALRTLAHQRAIAVVVIHHVRKMEADDPFDMVSGTNGLTGAADTILVLKRAGGNVTLYARGRDIEEAETACRFDGSTCRWTFLGDASEVHKTGERARILQTLAEAGETGMSTAEIMAATERTDRNAVDQLLYKMHRDGDISRVKRGVYACAGKNGKKERNDLERNEIAEESADLTVLTDLTETGQLERA